MTTYPRNVPILSVSYALAVSGVSMVALIGGIIGSDLSPNPALATLPVSLSVVGLALATIPAAFFMQRVGRRTGFLTSLLIAVAGALLCAYAIYAASFFLFSAGAFLIGTNGAFLQQYRFAALESVTPERAGRAVSFVLVGGILAGFIGPELAKLTRTLLPAGDYIASFLVLVGIYIIVAGLLAFLRDVKPQEADASGVERPLGQIISQPIYITAVLAGALGYGVMTFIMTATPIQMHHLSGFSLDQTTWVIQSHIIAMFLPSLFSGWLIERLGVARLLLLGILSLLATVFIGIADQQLLGYWWALVLLGIGWNFLFVGGTVLLSHSYHPRERFKAQAANDFTIFGVQALGSLSAGAVLAFASWNTLIWINLPVLLMIGAMILLLRRQNPGLFRV